MTEEKNVQPGGRAPAKTRTRQKTVVHSRKRRHAGEEGTQKDSETLAEGEAVEMGRGQIHKASCPQCFTYFTNLQ